MNKRCSVDFIFNTSAFAPKSLGSLSSYLIVSKIKITTKNLVGLELVGPLKVYFL
jgi:hypothetical protein